MYGYKVRIPNAENFVKNSVHQWVNYQFCWLFCRVAWTMLCHTYFITFLHIYLQNIEQKYRWYRSWNRYILKFALRFTINLRESLKIMKWNYLFFLTLWEYIKDAASHQRGERGDHSGICNGLLYVRWNSLINLLSYTLSFLNRKKHRFSLHYNS